MVMDKVERKSDRPPTPRWVKGFVAARIVLLLVALASAVSGHGPWRHFPHDTGVSR